MRGAPARRSANRLDKDLGQRLDTIGPLDFPTVKKRFEGVLFFSGRSMRRPPGRGTGACRTALEPTAVTAP